MARLSPSIQTWMPMCGCAATDVRTIGIMGRSEAYLTTTGCRSPDDCPDCSFNARKYAPGRMYAPTVWSVPAGGKGGLSASDFSIGGLRLGFCTGGTYAASLGRET